MSNDLINNPQYYLLFRLIIFSLKLCSFYFLFLFDWSWISFSLAFSLTFYIMATLGSGEKCQNTNMLL